MFKHSFSIALLIGLASQAPLAAQDNILAEKPVYPLGEAKTWTSSNDVTYTMKVENLSKLTAVPTNTSNIYLFPEEGGGWNSTANQQIGIQGFYVDMESSMNVGTVTTTWEGAAANAYDIYLTDVEPTTAILSTQPTYSAKKLGQYTSNTAVLPDGSKGRYLVFQPTDATNWGWGVKIRSISATAPLEAELTTIKVSPLLVLLGESTDITISALDQLGIAIEADKLTITTSSNATYADGKLTVNSGDTATITVAMGGKEISQTVYVASAPEVPALADIKTPIFTNGDTESNSTAGFLTAYNGGATNLGLYIFPDGEVAQGFDNARCIFFHNSATTGGWNGSIDPASNGYSTLHLSVYSTKDAQGTIEFEGVTKPADNSVVATNNFTLKAGEWNEISVNIEGATKLNNMSIRFNEANACTILLSNIYFTGAFVEGDEDAPVIESASATPATTSATFEMLATDNVSETIYYTITEGDNKYSTTGKSGETVTYVVNGLMPDTSYTFSITASDGKNMSEPKTVNVDTTPLPDCPAPEPAEETNSVKAIFSARYNATTVPVFANWGSQSTMTTVKTDNGEDVLAFSNYSYGGLDNLNITVTDQTDLHIDIYGDGTTGSIEIAPVWKDATGGTPGVVLTVEPGKWNSYNIGLTNFGYPEHGNDIIQLALTNSTMNSFMANNIFLWKDPHTSTIDLEASSEFIQEVYTVQGICVARNLSTDDLSSLPAGLYIVRYTDTVKKVIVK